MGLGGLLESIRNMICVKALVCAFWFGLEQVLESFFTREGQGPKLHILGDRLHSAKVL